jgi:glucosyl-3-phosphoglycerate synthase
MGPGETVSYVRMKQEEAGWGSRRTRRRPDSGAGRRTGGWPREQLIRWKDGQGARVSVVIPARDEEAPVGGVVGAIARAFMREQPLVDELVVIDSDSTDGTAEAVARAGAIVYRCLDVAEDLGAYPGKGEALWKSLLVTIVLVLVDADLTRWGAHFVTGLLGPLLDPAQGTLLVKACYDRLGDSLIGGGRVTELVARPLLNLWWPELAGVAQPLAGEWAAARSLLEALPIPVGVRRRAGRAHRYCAAARDRRDRPGRPGGTPAHSEPARRGPGGHGGRTAAGRRATARARHRGRVRGVGDQAAAGAALRQFTREDGALRLRPRAVPCGERPAVSALRPSVAE